MAEQARVIEVQRIHTTIRTAAGETLAATVRGEFHAAGEYPKVGDYVTFTRVPASEEAQAVIEERLPRRSVISRLDQATTQTQVLVANVDIIFIVMGLDGDYNVKRLERYLWLAESSNIKPVVVLNKADLAPDIHAQVEVVKSVAGPTPVHTVTATTGMGLDALGDYFDADTTAVLLGSSGAGKSTITNWFLKDTVQTTNTVRADDSRGRHTTTTRQLFALPQGGYLIDTPGIRELGIVDQPEQASNIIADITELAQQCRFRNCDHEHSAGCAVLAAVAAGELSTQSLENYHKLLREQEWQRDKHQSAGRYQAQVKKRSAQARAAAERKRLQGFG